MWKEYSVAALLLLNGIWDWKRREVCIPGILLSLVLGLAVNVRFQELSAVEMLGGLGIGVGMVILSFLTKGAIGMGDGWLLCATGVFLGAAGNFELLLTGALLCAAVLGIGLLLGKVHWKDSFPFAPFLCLAQFLRIFL